MIEIVTRKELKNLKEGIKKLDTIIAKNKSQIKVLELEKQKWEKDKNKYFSEIKKLNKTIKINEIYQIKEQIKNNNEEIAKLKNILPNKPLKKTYMIITSENEIQKANEDIIGELKKEEKLDNDIRTIEVVGTNLEEQMKNFNDNDLDKTLDLSKLKLKMAKLLVKLERKEYKTKKIFASIVNNELIIANKYLLITQENWQLYPNIRTTKEILNAQLKIKLRYKMSNICRLNLDISKKNLKIAKINKKITQLNININKKNITINNCFAIIRQIYNSQSRKVHIKILLKSPFIWLNKYFQKYKYQITLNKYQTQLKKLEKEIIKLETDKLVGNFYNKFWVIISCRFFDSRRKNEIREEKKSKLYEIKQKIYELKNQTNMQPQPSMSSNITSWNEVAEPNCCFKEV